MRKLRERKSFFRTIVRLRHISTGVTKNVRKDSSIMSGAMIRPVKSGYQKRRKDGDTNYLLWRETADGWYYPGYAA